MPNVLLLWGALMFLPKVVLVVSPRCAIAVSAAAKDGGILTWTHLLLLLVLMVMVMMTGRCDKRRKEGEGVMR